MVALEKVETELILETVPKARRSMVELPRLDKMEVIEHVEENRGGVGVDVVGCVLFPESIDSCTIMHI